MNFTTASVTQQPAIRHLACNPSPFSPNTIVPSPNRSASPTTDFVCRGLVATLGPGGLSPPSPIDRSCCRCSSPCFRSRRTDCGSWLSGIENLAKSAKPSRFLEGPPAAPPSTMGLLTIAGASQLNESSMARNNSDKCANDIFLLLATGASNENPKKLAGKFVFLVS